MKLRSRSFVGPLLAALLSFGAARRASATLLFQVDNGVINTQGCNGSGCWSNYLRLADIDADGDFDIVEPNYAGFFSNGTAQPLLVYQNDGNANFTLISAAAIGSYSGRVRQVAIGDLDGDGLPDIYAPDGRNNGPGALFMNQGGATFANEAATRLPNGQAAYAGGVRFGDLDGDGDLDIFIGDGYAEGNNFSPQAQILLNDGSGMFTAGGSVPNSSTGADPDDVDLLDVDRDFDLDVLINMHSGKSALWLNDGSANFTDATASWVTQPGGFHYNPGICDVDGDGDLDVWTDNMGPGYTEQLAINDGAGNFTDETAARVSNPMNGADDNGVACADVDGDDDFDAVVFNLFTQGGDPRVERVLFNDGAGNFTGSGPLDEFSVTNDATLWGEAADLDNDGRLDWATAQGESAGPLRVYLGTNAMPIDVQAPKIIATQAIGSQPAGTTPAIRFAVSDEVVTDSGPPLSLAWIEVDDGNGPQIVDAHFVGGDLFAAEAPSFPEGTTVTYKGCAADRNNNQACGAELTYDVTMGMGTGGGGMGGAGGGAGGMGGAGVGGAQSGGMGGTPASGGGGSDSSASSGGSGQGGGNAGDSESDGGCGCATPGGSPEPGRGLAWLLAGLGLALARRRR